MEVKVESWLSPEAAAAKYAETLSWDPATMPAGRSFHLGNGVWRSTCQHCEAYADTFGAQPRYSTIGPHEVDVHGAAVPGINLGLLP